MFGFQRIKMDRPCINRLICIMIVCLAAGASYSSTSWPNEPAGSQTFLDCPFNGNICSMSGAPYNTLPFAEPGGANQLNPGVLDEAMTGSAANGNGQWGIGFPSRMREVYMGVSWRTTVWGHPNGTNKMIFISNPSNSFLVWHGAPGTGAKTLKWYQQEYIDNCHISSMCPSQTGDGTGRFEPNVNAAAATIAPDDNIFHRVEIYLRGSTTRTSQDGVIRIWVDGVLSTNYTNVNQGVGGGITQGPPYSFTGGEFPGGFRSATITATWDGGTGTQCQSPSNPGGRDCSHDWHHYFDHLYISFPNCGSGGCPAPAYLVINSSLLPARTGTPYSATLTADGGTKPYTWFRESGNLPAGLTLNQSTGIISGSPTCAGRSDFTIRVTDASKPALTTTKSYSIITSGTGTCPAAIATGFGPKGKAISFTAKASGKLVFSLPVVSSTQYRLSVYDLTGKKVYEHSSIGQREISIAKALNSGVYVAKFEQGKNANTVRFSVMN